MKIVFSEAFRAWSFAPDGLLLCKIPSENTPEELIAIKTQKTVSHSFLDICFAFCYLKVTSSVLSVCQSRTTLA